MKKTYVNPTLVCVIISEAEMIAGEASSVAVGGTVEKSEDIGYVKSESTPHGGKSVWDDDWSK